MGPHVTNYLQKTKTKMGEQIVMYIFFQRWKHYKIEENKVHIWGTCSSSNMLKKHNDNFLGLMSSGIDCSW